MPQADVVDGVHQNVDIDLVEASAKVARGYGVGNPLGAQGLQLDFVVASQFEVFQTSAARENIVGHIEDLIRLVVRQMDLEQVQPSVDGLDQPGPAGQPTMMRNVRSYLWSTQRQPEIVQSYFHHQSVTYAAM